MKAYAEIEEMISPCAFGVAEAEARIMKSTADVDSGNGLLTNEEFKKQVEKWRK
jgi:hypothetical protein